MSTLYLGTDAVGLAGRLAEHLDEQGRVGDPFVPAVIVVPNPYLGKWLRLWLARRHGIAINLQFAYLESTLWKLLREVDPRTHDPLPELIDDTSYELLVLSCLWHDDDPDLGPLQRYFSRGADPGRPGCRRAWRLAQRLGALIRDYEYHRQEQLIQPWLQNQRGLSDAGPGLQELERAQKAIFRAIVAEQTGRRARLGQALGRNFRTLPQYAMEVMELPETRSLPGRMVHVFGYTGVSMLHMQTLRWLGRHADLRIYHLNPLLGQLDDAPMAGCLEKVRRLYAGESDLEMTSPAALLRAWGRAGAESLCIMGQLLTDGVFQAATVQRAPVRLTKKARSKKPPEPACIAPGQDTVLRRVQEQVLGRTVNPERLPPDTSLQVIACPGIVREVETVYQSILHNLNHNPDLRQSDVAILVTDMARYRPVLQAVFERLPRRLGYNLVDYAAAGQSRFGQALIGMLDLALESFTRSRVLEVLLNPCFLARLGVEPDQAQTWLLWVEELGIYQAWDAQDKAERGYAPSASFGWKLGLQRLRLGRFMDADKARFGDVLPFADLASGDRGQLDAFSRAVEGLLPTLARLRARTATATQWAELVRQLMSQFLDLPEDRPEEGVVRDQVLLALERWPSLDALADEPSGPRYPLALVREYLASSLDLVAGRRGEPLAGGVTIAALLPMRPVPFEVIYVVGLGEDIFPGNTRLPSLDLRGAGRQPGDIRPAEQNRFLFLESILSAQRKLYLLYNCRDLQKDQELLPCVAIQQLRRHVRDHIIQGEWQEVRAPLHASDVRLLRAQRPHPGQDVLVQYHELDCLLALEEGLQTGEVCLGLNERAELQERLAARRPDFAVAAAPPAQVAEVDISLKELRRYLACPALAALRRHLRLDDDEEECEARDDEPFVTSADVARRLIVGILEEVATAAGTGRLDEILAQWPRLLDEQYQGRQLRCQAPEGAFAAVDRAALKRTLQERIHGEHGLEAWLRQRAGQDFCGPLLVGDSLTPLHPLRRFPALRLSLEDGRTVSLRGTAPLAWHASKSFDLLVITTSKKKFSGEQLCLPLLDPILLYLALLANSAVAADNVSSQDWLAGRDFTVHLAAPEGIFSIAYPRDLFTPARAEQYLRELARDLLDGQCFDLLPFEVIVANDELREAYQAGAEAEPVAADEYQRRLQDAIDDEKENTFGSRGWSWGTELEELARPEAPIDALAKVERRFRLLDAGPALVRQAKLDALTAKRAAAAAKPKTRRKRP